MSLQSSSASSSLEYKSATSLQPYRKSPRQSKRVGTNPESSTESRRYLSTKPFTRRFRTWSGTSSLRMCGLSTRVVYRIRLKKSLFCIILTWRFLLEQRLLWWDRVAVGRVRCCSWLRSIMSHPLEPSPSMTNLWKRWTWKSGEATSGMPGKIPWYLRQRSGITFWCLTRTQLTLKLRKPASRCIFGILFRNRIKNLIRFVVQVGFNSLSAKSKESSLPELS